MNFPADEYLPENVTLSVGNVFSEDLVAEFKEAFDVVHVRAFAAVVTGDRPGGLIGKMRGMCSEFFSFHFFVDVFFLVG